MHLTIAASGSSGNMAYIGNKKLGFDSCGFLIDCGISSVIPKLEGMGVMTRNLMGALYTHRHSDHFRKSNYRLLEKKNVAQHVPFDVPYLEPGEKVPHRKGGVYPSKPPIYNEPLDFLIETFRQYFDYDIDIKEFECKHDAPCTGYAITLEDDSYLTWIPDTSCLTQEIHDYADASSIVCIECNYDLEFIRGMVSEDDPTLREETKHILTVLDKKAPYSQGLIHRIIEEGHMGTDQVMECMKFHPNVGHWILMHMSERYQHPYLIEDRLKNNGLGDRHVTFATKSKPIDLSLDMLSWEYL